MKGSIVKCLEELVKGAGGEAAWTKALVDAGLDEFSTFSMMEDIPDGTVMSVVEHAANALGMPLQDALDAFGIHWASVYAPRVYEMYYERARSARQFLRSMAEVHRQVTRRIANASPPRFEYRDEGETVLIMTYGSARGLVALLPGLVRGVAKYYGEEVEVGVAGNDARIRFLSPASKAA